jgi:hypothetical protein
LNTDDLENFERDLGRLRPANPSEEFVTRLRGSHRVRRSTSHSSVVAEGRLAGWLGSWLGRLRWLAPATAVLLAAVVFWRSGLQTSRPGRPSVQTSNPAMKVDDVQIDRRIISSFDAVALLPSGEPVRFRCNEWVDDVVLRDHLHQLAIEQHVPRVQAIPVGFDTY